MQLAFKVLLAFRSQSIHIYCYCAIKHRNTKGSYNFQIASVYIYTTTCVRLYSLFSLFSYDTRAGQVTTQGPDARGQTAQMSPQSGAKHWKDKNLKERAFFRTMTEPSTLKIDEIAEIDEGEYRCRIDYLRSPTKNLRVKLTVIGKFILVFPKKKRTISDFTFLLLLFINVSAVVLVSRIRL